MRKYKFTVKLNGKVYDIEIKSARNKAEAWYLINKQFEDDAEWIELNN